MLLSLTPGRDFFLNAFAMAKESGYVATSPILAKVNHDSIVRIF